GAPTREFETDVAAPRRRKHEHLFLVHFLAKPRHELLDVSHEPLGLDGRGDNLRIVHEVSLARTSLIPMHDREVLLQPMRGKPCHRCGWKARSTMNHEQDRIATIVPSNANELGDPADPHGLIALDPVRGDDATQLPHDIDCLLAARKSVRLSNSRL